MNQDTVYSKELKHIVEAALLASGKPLSLDQLLDLFEEPVRPQRQQLTNALQELTEDYIDRGIEVREISSGYRIQVRPEFAPFIARMWEERPARYSRALMETLALIAYRQPITRGEIEDIRGVSVSTNIIRTLTEREWVRVVGHRDVPGRPSLYATTRSFLDYFGMKSLNELPTLAEIRDLDTINQELDLPDPEQGDRESAPTAVDTRVPATEQQQMEPASETQPSAEIIPLSRKDDMPNGHQG